MANPIMADVLTFVEKAGTALHASRELAESLATEQEKVASLLPVDADGLAGIKLLDGSNLIEANEKQAAIAKLSTHQGTLEVLHNVLDIFGAQLKTASQAIQMHQQGQPEKQASAHGAQQPSGVIGARHGNDDQPESWTKMAAALGAR